MKYGYKHTKDCCMQQFLSELSTKFFLTSEIYIGQTIYVFQLIFLAVTHLISLCY